MLGVRAQLRTAPDARSYFGFPAGSVAIATGCPTDWEAMTMSQWPMSSATKLSSTGVRSWRMHSRLPALVLQVPPRQIR